MTIDLTYVSVLQWNYNQMYMQYHDYSNTDLEMYTYTLKTGMPIGVKRSSGRAGTVSDLLYSLIIYLFQQE